MTSLLEFITSGNDSSSGVNPIRENSNACVPSDKVMCLECQRLVGRLNATHLKMHNMTSADYRSKYPGAAFISQKEREAMSRREGMSPEARKAASERIKGKNNPAYQHGGKFSPFSDKFVKGYSAEWNAKFAAEQSERMKEGAWLPNIVGFWVSKGYSEQEAKQLVADSQARGRDYYVSKGLTLEEACARVEERNQRWYETCQKNFGAKTPLECSSILAKVAETLGWEEDRTEIEEYYIKVWRLTEQNSHLVEGIEARSKAFHLDHIFSVKRGFDLGVAPEIVAHPVNLRILPAADNITKGARCDKTLQQLLEGYKHATK